MCDIPDECAVSVVNLFDNLVDSRKEREEDILRPAFESLLHNGVVGICKGLGYNFPCIVPAVSAVVKANSHKLGNCQCRMCVIYVYGHL